MTEMTDTPQPRGHETRDVNLRAIMWGTIGVGSLILFTVATMYGLFGVLAKRQARLSPPPSPLAETYGRQQPPEPRLQADPIRDLATLRATESHLLESYGWVDRDTGTVRIPIERAIELMVARAAGSTVARKGDAR